MNEIFGLSEAFFDEDNEEELGQETAQEGVDIPDDVEVDEPTA